MHDKQYHAFISYSHSDSKIAAQVHRWLETYRVHRRLVGRETPIGKVPSRLVPIFRDREELPTSADLGAQIRNALERSKTLIVICSPRSARSRWVNEEILTYKRLGKASRILCLIVDGDPNAPPDSSGTSQECFAPALRFHLGDDGELSNAPAEPIAADIRPGKDTKQDSLLKLVAGIVGIELDELRQRHRRRERFRRLVNLLLVFTVGGCLCFAVFSQLAANKKRVEAELASRKATERRAEAEREKDRATTILNAKFEADSKAIFERLQAVFPTSQDTINAGTEEIEVGIAYSVIPNGPHRTEFQPPGSEFLIKGTLPVRIDVHLTVQSPGVESTKLDETLLEFSCDSSFSETAYAWNIAIPMSLMVDYAKKREILPQLAANAVEKHMEKLVRKQQEGAK